MDASTRLAAARGRAAEKEAAESRRRTLRAQIAERETSLEKLDERLRDEEGDVARLEGAGLTAMFASMLGTREQRLSKERAEALAARLQRDACCETLDQLLADERAISARIAALGDAPSELAEAARDREAELVASGSPSARRLADIDAALAAGRSSSKELAEAVAAADGALAALARVLDALNSARNWGTWDMLGGGMLATYAKHSRIDDARAAAHVAQSALDRFAREMADVRGAASRELVVEIGGFSKFADYFFDGLVADWVVQEKIAASRRNVEQVERGVRDARTDLASKAAEVRHESEALEAQRRRVVEEA